ncbi:MAG: hypothetical protein ACTSP3_02590 [Candidatus Heimdallarchaeaceae archaeon]
MNFRLYKDRLFHTTHNVANAKEFMLMLDLIDDSIQSHSLVSIMKKLLISEIQQGLFQIYHKKPFRIFTEGDVDKDSLLKKISEEFHKSNFGSLHPIIKTKLKEFKNPEQVVNWLIKERKRNFNRFIANPEKNYELFIKGIYKPTKTWEKNWVEFVRDFADLGSIMGLIPNYEKAGYLLTGFEQGYNSSETLRKLKRLMNDSEKFNDLFIQILMDTKIRSSVLDISRFKDYNIQIRPFYSTLKLLALLKEKKLTPIEHKILFGTLGCLNSEREMNEAVKRIEEFSQKNPDYNNKTALYFNNDKTFIKEAGRISTGMRDFLIHTGLIEEVRAKSILIDISEKGLEIIKKVPERSFFYMNYNFGESVKLNLLHVHLLYKSYIISNLVEKKVTKEEFFCDLNNLSKTEIEEIMFKFLKKIDFKPFKLTNENVIISPRSEQIAISPYLDFANKENINFILHGGNVPNVDINIGDVPSLDRLKEKYREGKLIELIKELSIGKVWITEESIVWMIKIFDSDTQDTRDLVILIRKHLSTEEEVRIINKVKTKLKKDSYEKIDFWIIYYSQKEIGKKHLDEIKNKIYNENLVDGYFIINNFSEECLLLYIQYLYKKRTIYQYNRLSVENLEVSINHDIINCFWDWCMFEKDFYVFDTSQFETLLE